MVAGIDEAGRGSLFGPVFAAAVVLSTEHPIRGLRDSKQLPAARREALADQIRRYAQAWAVASAEAEEIDRINILQASRLAMKRAVELLPVCPDFLLIDAISVDLPIPQQGLVKGDCRCRSIAAASILAKVHRDASMCEWDTVYPRYGLRAGKGYPTPEHVRALEQFGPTPMHRFTFEPVRKFRFGEQLDLPLGSREAADQCH
jgi:ribonuclease HII